MRQTNIAQNSKTSYKNTMCRFIEFLYVNDRHLLQDKFIEMISNASGSTLLKSIKSLNNAQSLRYDLLQWRDFMNWIETLRKKDGAPMDIAPLILIDQPSPILIDRLEYIWMRI